MRRVLVGTLARVLSVFIVFFGRTGGEDGGAFGRGFNIRLPILKSRSEDGVGLCENGLILGDSKLLEVSDVGHLNFIEVIEINLKHASRMKYGNIMISLDPIEMI